LRKLAQVDGEVRVQVDGQVTQRAILDALEAQYPVLRGTIRDHVTQHRRDFVSLEAPDTPLPEAVAKGEEPFLVVGAIAGG
jgi:hypothetical protein